jgi:glycosyltransferase involved in cell wall biosynthesis
MKNSLLNKLKISAVVATRNEEKNIKNCLAALAWVDEIIIVDMKSTDNTREIAKKSGANVFISDGGVNKLVAFSKNIGFKKAKGEWILVVDADERVSKRLAREIKKITSRKTSEDAYKIPIPTYHWGKWLFHGWDLYQVRLFKKAKCNGFTQESIHAQLEIKGKIGKLKGSIYHYGHLTVFDFIEKMNSYTSQDAKLKYKAGAYRLSWYELFKDTIYNFYAHFIKLRGYRDGMHGFTMSAMMAIYHFVERVKLWELQYKKDFDEISKFDGEH